MAKVLMSSLYPPFLLNLFFNDEWIINEANAPACLTCQTIETKNLVPDHQFVKFCSLHQDSGCLLVC
jgi:hypothetical protein